MPRGFPDIESGASLSPRLKKIVGRFVAKLKATRQAGKVDAKNGVNARRICEVFAAEGIKIRDSDVRAMVNWCARQRIPIISNGKGYSIAYTKSELKETLEQLYDRKAGIHAHIDGLEHAFDEPPVIHQENLFQEENNGKSI